MSDDSRRKLISKLKTGLSGREIRTVKRKLGIDLTNITDEEEFEKIKIEWLKELRDESGE